MGVNFKRLEINVSLSFSSFDSFDASISSHLFSRIFMSNQY